MHQPHIESQRLDWYMENAVDPSHIPESVEVALKQEYNEPTHITIKKEGKYWRIIDKHYEEM